MAKKFYAVKKGVTPGIYESWAECKAQTDGVSGAIFKGFATKEEAEDYMDKGIVSENASPALSGTEAVAYVDGSYDDSTKSFSYGVVFFYNGEELHFSEKCENEELVSMRNVAGEIEGAKAAIKYCLEHNIPSITIYHDYEGIARWCTGEWEAKKPGTIAYAGYYKEASLRLKIQFVKVKGHSGDKYNELADKLAKAALKI